MATTLTLDDELEARVEKLAEARGQSPDALMRDALTQYVDRVEKAREAFWREADESWEDYKRTGLHITGEELFEWLSKWGTDGETPMPKCHK